MAWPGLCVLGCLKKKKKLVVCTEENGEFCLRGDDDIMLAQHLENLEERFGPPLPL